MRIIFFLLLILTLKLNAQNDSLLIPYRSGDKWGYSDVNKRMVIPPMYDEVLPFLNGRALVMKDLENGIIDRNNNIIVPFSTEENELFTSQMLNEFYIEYSEDKQKKSYLIITKELEKPDTDEDFSTDSLGEEYLISRRQFYGLTHENGTIVLPCTYDYIRRKENFYIVEKDQNSALFDLNGKQLTQFKYMVIGEFESNRSKVRVGDKYGYINTQGEEVIPVELKFNYPFSQGLARVKSEKWGQIDTTGKMIIPFIYDQLGPLHLNVFSAKIGYKWALISKNGKELTRFEYDDIKRVYNGVIAARKNEKWFVLSPEGKIVSKTAMDTILISEADENNISDFGHRRLQYDEGYLMFKQNNIWGLIKKNGDVVIPPIYQSFTRFINGIATIKQNEKCALINSEGKQLTDFLYDNIIIEKSRYNKEEDSILVFRRNGKCGFMDATGKEIVPPNYEFIRLYKFPYYLIGKEGKAGVINSKGSIILPAIYDDIEPAGYLSFMEIFKTYNYFPVTKDGKGGFVSPLGVEYFD